MHWKHQTFFPPNPNMNKKKKCICYSCTESEEQGNIMLLKKIAVSAVFFRNSNIYCIY